MENTLTIAPLLEEMIKVNERSFMDSFGYEADLTAFSPGRINIIGEHTDYSEGMAMPAAINRWVVVSFKKRDDQKVTVVSSNFEEKCVFDLHEKVSLTESWQKFVQGAIGVVSESFTLDKGFDIYVHGNIPIGSGVSSSAAFEVALLNGIRKLYMLVFDDIQLVKMAQKIEHKYLGVLCGLMDQYAVVFSEENRPMALDFRSLTHKAVDVDMDGYCFVLVNTMVHRELSGSKYTERVTEMYALKKLYQEVGYSHLREVSKDKLDIVKDATLYRRMKHYITAVERVEQALQVIADGDLEALGRLLTASHYSLKDDYEISCPELDYLVTKALTFEGCLGARMMGGGFGGCTINLVNSAQLESFQEAIAKAYSDTFNIIPEINVYQLVNGAGVK